MTRPFRKITADAERRIKTALEEVGIEPR